MDEHGKLTIFILFRIVPIFFHSLGLYLLLTINFMKRYQRIQGRYLLWLSSIEIAMNVTKIAIQLTKKYGDVAFYLDTLRTGFIGMQMLLILMAMTIDRAVYVFLSFQYKMKKANKATNKIICCVLLLAILVTVTLFLTQDTKTQLSRTKVVYFWPIIDGIVLLTFVFCYISMIKTTSDRSKKLFGAESERFRNRMQKATLVPKLIVFSFIICWSSSDIIYLGFALAGKEVPNWLIHVINVFICTGYTTDAVFYIYFCRPVRRMLKSKITKSQAEARVGYDTTAEFSQVTSNNNN
eukprot:TCONS_00073273-protein